MQGTWQYIIIEQKHLYHPLLEPKFKLSTTTSLRRFSNKTSLVLQSLLVPFNSVPFSSTTDRQQSAQNGHRLDCLQYVVNCLTLLVLVMNSQTAVASYLCHCLHLLQLMPDLFTTIYSASLDQAQKYAWQVDISRDSLTTMLFHFNSCCSDIIVASFK